jgi:EAL and modified HD-GYP domain-containing signal transduction protein
MHSFTRLAMLARIAEEKPPHLLVTALTRARMCELLAQAANRRRPETYFVAGMFSVLDALLDKPMPEALESLPLEDEIRSALLNHSGPIADIVQCAVNYDQTEFDRVHVDGLSSHAVRSAYLDALGWAAEASLTAASLA